MVELMEEKKPKLENAVFTFTQEANCNSSEEYEEITITFDSSLGVDRDEGGFFILNTKQWAVDDENDLKELFERIKKIL